MFTEPAPLAHDSYAVFRNPNYRLLLASVFLSTILQQTQGVALGWYIYERTGSVLALGWMGLVQFLPVMLLFLPAGHLADRYDRRKIMVGSLVLWFAGSVELALAAWTHADVGWLYLGLAASGTAMVVNRPARDALLPQIVGPGQLSSAVAWHSTNFQVAAVSGPALAGFILAAGGAVPVYLMNCGLALVSLMFTLMIAAPPVTARHRAPSWGEVFGGIAHVRRTPIVLGVMSIDLFAILLGSATALLPVYAKDILHVGPAALGWLSAAPAVGAVLMAVGQGTRRPWERSGHAFLWSVAGFGAATMVFGLSQSFWLSFFALAVTGACDNIGAIIRQTAVQLYTPDELRGRVSAVNRVFISSSNELGAFYSGSFAALTGPLFAVVFGGGMTIAVAVAGIWLFPALRRLGRL